MNDTLMCERYKELYENYGDVLTVMEVAEYLNVCSNTIYMLLKTRKIRARRVASKWRITRKNIIDYLEKTA